VDFGALGVDALTFTAHKFHGPPGIGGLVMTHRAALAPRLVGGYQQAGARPGTESVALAVGMCTALEIWSREAAERERRLRALRDRFEQALLAGWPAACVIGDAPRLPHTSNVALVGLDRQELSLALDLAGVACSTGSACASGSSEVSPVHLAMGLPDSMISSAMRFSFGVTTMATDIDLAVERILNVCRRLRR
ncbi:MAG: aminotransferase class V-fold PLP-dependent enzyme, partial [Planctomycetota bacterium]